LALGERGESDEVECIGVCEPNGKTTEKMIPLTGKDIIEGELPADLVLLLEKNFFSLER